jgi:penicillin-binding protein A
VNRALRRISIAVLVMFVLLLVNINYLQGFEPASLATKPNNARAFEAQFQYQRGNIVTSDNVTVAESKPSSDVYKYQRFYPRGPEYAPVTGYDTLYSQTGIEQYENSVLNGSDSSLTVRNLIDLLTGKQRKGASVTLTINSKAQDAAWNALQSLTGGKPGAVVALDPKTGAILAMASYPSYDPNVLATHDGNKLISADKALLAQAGNPLLNRAINFSVPPGSTFKIVTSSAYLTRTAGSGTQSNVYSPTQLKLPNGNLLNNNDGEKCAAGTGQTTLITAFAESCDTTFANLGVQLGNVFLKNSADLLGAGGWR